MPTISLARAQLHLPAFTRPVATLAQIPVPGGRGIPARVPAALGVLLTMLLSAWQPLPAESAAPSPFELVFANLRELTLGVMACGLARRVSRLME